MNIVANIKNRNHNNCTDTKNISKTNASLPYKVFFVFMLFVLFFTETVVAQSGIETQTVATGVTYIESQPAHLWMGTVPSLPGARNIEPMAFSADTHALNIPLNGFLNIGGVWENKVGDGKYSLTTFVQEPSGIVTSITCKVYPTSTWWAYDIIWQTPTSLFFRIVWSTQGPGYQVWNFQNESVAQATAWLANGTYIGTAECWKAAQVVKVEAIPPVLYIDPPAGGSEITFKATTTVPTNVTFKIKSNTQEWLLSSVPAKGPANVAELVWSGQFSNGAMITPGVYSIVALGADGQRKEAPFEVKEDSVRITSLISQPGTLFVDRAGYTSGVIFRASTSRAANVDFSVRSPDGEIIPVAVVETKDIDGTHIAGTKWLAAKISADFVSGSYALVAKAGADSKEISFEVKQIDADALGYGTWLANKDPSAGQPSEPAPETCPLHRWAQLVDRTVADFHNLTVSDPVNVIFGNYVFSEIDLEIKGKNSLVLARTYNSLDSEIGQFGRGWSSPFTSRLDITQNKVWFVNSDGSRLLFTSSDGQNYAGPARTNLKLSFNQAGEFWTISQPEGDQWAFNSDGQLIRMVRKCCGNGLADVTNLDYNQDQKLIRITSSAGSCFSVTNDEFGRIIQVTDHTGRTVGFSYDENSNLTHFSNPTGQITTYRYGDDKLLEEIIKPGAITTKIRYQNGMVCKQIFPDGGAANFEWDIAGKNMILTAVDGVNHVYSFSDDWVFRAYSIPSIGLYESYDVANFGLSSFKNSLQAQKAFAYSSDGLLIRITDFQGNTSSYEYHPIFKKLTSKTDALGRTWSYDWCARGNLIRETDPAGNITRYTYDSHNNRTSKTDPLGRVTRYVYDSTGNYLMQTIDAMGGISSFTYDLRGNMLTSTDVLGRTTAYQYDLLDRLVKTTYPDGRHTQVIYDEAGNIASRKDNLSRTTAYTYDAAGRMLTTTRPDGSVLSHAYDASGRKISSTDALGRVTGYEYDALDNLVKVTYPDQSCQTYVYDTEKRLISSSDELGNVSAYEYDPMGRMLATIDPAGARYESTYDVAGRKVAARDPLGRTTTWAYDVLDRVTKTTAPDQTFSLSAYDAVGNLLISTNALNQQTVYEYDALNRQIKTTRPGGAQFVTAYDAGGQVVSETDALGNKTSYSYDAGGRRVATTRADGKQFTSVYDNAGRLVKTIDPLNASSTLSYDIMDRAVAETDALGRTTRYEYDAGGKRIAKIDAMGRRSLYGYDTRDRLTTEVDAEGRMVSHAYDAAGRKTGLTDGAGRIWRWVYDAVGRVVAEIDPLGHEVKSSYDLAGNPVLKTNARNQATGYEYDLMNRLVKVNYPDATAATFSYDALGRELVRSGAAGAVEKSYDLAGNMVSEKFINHNKAWNYSFDLMGKRIQAISPENETFRFSYDSLGRLLTSEASATGIISRVYDGMGRVVEERRPGSITRSSYDTAGQLLEVRHDSVNAEGQPQLLLSLRQYVYDAAGNRLSMKDEDGRITTYAYDGSNWLTRVDYPNGQFIKYAYNGAGDRVSEQIGNDVVLTSSYDAAGRLLSRGSDTFGYDADGNLINAVEGEIPASYTWNSDNRLTMVSRVHNGCKHDKDRNGYGYGHLKHGSSFVEYEKYDYLPEDWRRITRTAGVQKTAKNKTPAVEEEVFVSIYDGSDESHEYRLLTGKAASLQLEQSYISDPGTDDMNFTLSAGKTLTMLKDGLGSTVSLTGNDGKVLAKIGYDAWGRFMWPAEAEDGSFDRSKDDWSDYLNRLDKTRSFGKHNAWAFGKQFADQLTPYLYTGRRFSAMTGEYWNRHRYYSPALGQFTSKDPIRFRGGHNLWKYADNNPMRWVDPWGLFLLPVVTDDTSCPRSRNYYLTMPHQPISEVTWGTADFVWHYYTGGGSGVNLADIGLLEAFKNSESVQQSIRTLKLMIDNAAFSKAGELCNPCEKGQKDGSFDVEYTPTSSVVFDPGLFSVGKSSFFQKAKCRASVNCDDRAFSFSCSTDFRISDKFIDPLELGFEPGGTPYDINAAWSGTYSGNDNF